MSCRATVNTIQGFIRDPLCIREGG